MMRPTQVLVMVFLFSGVILGLNEFMVDLGADFGQAQDISALNKTSSSETQSKSISDSFQENIAQPEGGLDFGDSIIGQAQFVQDLFTIISGLMDNFIQESIFGNDVFAGVPTWVSTIFQGVFAVVILGAVLLLVFKVEV